MNNETPEQQAINRFILEAKQKDDELSRLKFDLRLCAILAVLSAGIAVWLAIAPMI